MLDPWRLRLLVQLEGLGTMHEVARVMRLSPSTVSQQLAILEKEAGAALLERSGRRVRLTGAGAGLVRRARPVLSELDALTEWTREEGTLVRGRVRVASFASMLTPVVIPAAHAVMARFPDLELTVTEREPDESLPSMDRGDLDVVLSARYGDDTLPLAVGTDEVHTVVPLLSDGLWAIVPANHRLSGRSRIHIHDLKDDPWALEEEPTYLARFVNRLCEGAGFVPRREGTFREHGSLMHYVASGLAVSVLPEMAIDRSVPGLVAIPLSPPIMRHVDVVTRTTHLQRAAVRAVIDELVRTAAAIRPTSRESSVAPVANRS